MEVPAVAAARAEEYRERYQNADAQFAGLLDDEALRLLVLDEMGLNAGAYATLDDLKGRGEATVRVSVERIEPPRTFTKGEREGRVCNVVVSDATGKARMVLWDKDVEKAEDGTLRPGARLTLVNARVKDGQQGAELHVGPWSVLEMEGALDPARRKLLADVAPDQGGPLAPTDLPEELTGALIYVSSTRSYRKPDGSPGFVLDADLETAEGPRRVVVWETHVKQVRALAPRSRVRMAPLSPKVRGAMTEWHTTRETRIDPADGAPS